MKRVLSNKVKCSACLAALLAILIQLSTGYAEAAVWLAGEMSDAGDHPRTVLLPDQIDLVKSRAMKEAYSRLLKNVQYWASRSYDAEDQSEMNELRKSPVAKAAAFKALIGIGYETDVGPFELSEDAIRELQEKAFTYLLNMNTDSTASSFHPDGDLRTAETLLPYAQAYDLLKGAGFDFDGREAEVVQNIADLTADAYAAYEIQHWPIYRSYLNNHRSKFVSAIGMAAISLNGHEFEAKFDDGRYDIYNWVDLAIRSVDLTHFDIMADWEGGYQESFNYIIYAGSNVFPFLWAWHQYTDGADWTIDPHDPYVPPFQLFGQQEPYTISDFWTNPILGLQTDWMQRLLQPDYTSPPFDDCSPGSRLAFGFFINNDFENAGLYRWFWERQIGGAQFGGLVGACEQMVSFDDEVQETPPDGATEMLDQVLPLAGNVVFRTSWESDAVYLHLSAEHGKAAGLARTRWGESVDGVVGHEHSEAGSFILWAYGEALAIDSGYLGWDNHGKVNKADNHNIILIDGEGPVFAKAGIPDFYFDENGDMIITDPAIEAGWIHTGEGEGWLLRSKKADSDLKSLRFAEIWTEYNYEAPPVEIRRRVLMLDDRAILIYDEIKPLDDEEHELTFQLHGHGGEELESGDFAQEEFGGLWTRETAALRSLIASDREITISNRSSIHDSIDVFNRHEMQHRALDASLSLGSGETGRFLALLMPLHVEDSVVEEMDVAVLKDGGDRAIGFSWESDGKRWQARLGEEKVLVQEEDLSLEAGLIVWRREESQAADVAFGIGVTKFGPESNPWFSSDEPVSFWWEKGTDGYQGELFSNLRKGDLANPEWDKVLIKLPEADAVIGACSAGLESGAVSLYTAPDTLFTLVSSDAQSENWLPVRIQAYGEEAELHAEFDRPEVWSIFERIELESFISPCMGGDDGPVNYEWLMVRQPEFSEAELIADEDEKKVSFIPDYPGEYIVELNIEKAELSGSDRRMLTTVGQPRLLTPADGDEDLDLDLQIDGDLIEAEEEIVSESDEDDANEGDGDAELDLDDIEIKDDFIDKMESEEEMEEGLHSEASGCGDCRQGEGTADWWLIAGLIVALFLRLRRRGVFQ